MTNNQIGNIDTNHTPSVTVTLEVNSWIQEVKHHANLIAGYKKETEHWQKRELESAIVCGDNLIKIRKTFGDIGTGFKQLIIDEFKNQFSYSTALRYMKLHHGRKDITTEITNTRQAYIKLGILRESYQYPDDESNPSGGSGSANNGSASTKTTKPRKQATRRTLNDLLPHSQSIYITWKDETNNSSSHSIYEFSLNDDKVLIGRPVANTVKFSIVKPAGVEWFLNRLKPMVDWHNLQMGTMTKASTFEPQQINQLKMAA